MSLTPLRAAWLCLFALFLLLNGCQGSSPSGGPRPRSREAAGTNEGLPDEGDTSNRMPINTSGGELKFRLSKLTLPVGAVSETVFVESSIPSEPPGTEVMPDTAYQLNPNGFELNKDALLELGYYDEDIPKGRTEDDIIMVHNVNGVWVEVPNFRLHAINNSVDAPIRYLGLYALQIRNIDARTMNTAPIALFEYSTKAYKVQAGATADTPESELKKALQNPPADAGTGGAGGGGAGTGGGEGDSTGVDTGAGAAQGGSGASPGAAPQAGKIQGAILERRFIAGPEDKAADKGKSKSPAEQKQADEQREADQSGASNVAEGGGGAEPGAEAPAEPAGGGDAGTGEEKPVHDKPQQDASGTTIYFNAAASSDPDGRIVQYDWDFDSDGIFDFTSHVGPYAKHVFAYSGDYSVTLKVTDNGRYAMTAFNTQVVEIRNKDATPKALSANIAAYPPFGPCPLTVHFASTVTGGVPPYSYNWQYSDGSQSNLANPFTTFPDIDSHLVSFTVTDMEGETLDGSLMVQSCEHDTWGEPLPRMTAEITPGTDQGLAPLTSQFTVETERATEPVSYRILYGDEAPGESETVTQSATFSHSYTNAGFYLLKVIATDADLKTASTFASVHVIAPDMARDFTPSTPDAGMDPFSFGHPMHIEYDYTEASDRTVRFYPEDAPGGTKNLGFNWDFGDGNFSTEAKPTHTYARDGVYEVRLTASDGIQRWRHRIWMPVSQKKTAVAVQRPFYVEGPAPLRMQWDCIVTRGKEPMTYQWNFGGDKRSDPSTFYTFTLPGDYEVALKVTDKFDQVYDAPLVKVHVRPGTAQYRMPLAAVEDFNGSTRATVTDYDAAYPLPLSNSNVEGPVTMVDLSPDGQRIGIVTADGVLVKNVADGDPLISFLPAVGKITAVRVLNCDGVFVTVESSEGARTLLIRSEADPLDVGRGLLLDASADGTAIILKEGSGKPAQGLDTPLQIASNVTVDPDSGYYSDPKQIGKLYEAALTADGKELFYINANQRVTRLNLGSGKELALTGDGGKRYNLAVSAEGNAVAFVAKKGDEQDLIYGHLDDAGNFELTSVNDSVGFFAQQFKLSADGEYLLAYGSRKRIQALLEAARPKGSKKEVQVDAEEISFIPGPPSGPPEKRDRYGVIRLDLGSPAQSWDINKVNPRFVIESSTGFDAAGPFN